MWTGPCDCEVCLSSWMVFKSMRREFWPCMAIVRLNENEFILEWNRSACYGNRFWSCFTRFESRMRREITANGRQKDWKRATKTRPKKAEDAEQDSPSEVIIANQSVEAVSKQQS